MPKSPLETSETPSNNETPNMVFSTNTMVKPEKHAIQVVERRTSRKVVGGSASKGVPKKSIVMNSHRGGNTVKTSTSRTGLTTTTYTTTTTTSSSGLRKVSKQ